MWRRDPILQVDEKQSTGRDFLLLSVNLTLLAYSVSVVEAYIMCPTGGAVAHLPLTTKRSHQNHLLCGSRLCVCSDTNWIKPRPSRDSSRYRYTRTHTLSQSDELFPVTGAVAVGGKLVLVCFYQ